MCDESIAADEATPCEKLFELANSSQLVIARIVAENASISSDVVAALQLRKDPKINRALAANPATPMAILQKLGVRYTSEFVHNPIFKMEQISDPLFLTHLQARLLKKILTHESTPESILLWACEHRDDFDFDEDDTVEEWLISSPRSLRVIYSELSANTRREIAQLEHLPQEIVCALAADEDVDVRLAVAERHDLSEAFVQQLSNDAVEYIRHRIAQREHLSQEIVSALAADQNVGVRWRVAGRHDLSEAFVQQLSKDVDKDVRRYIARREHLPQEIVCALAADQDVGVRWMVAGRHDLPTTVVQQLSKDVHNNVRHHIAQREHLPQEIVSALAADQDVGVRRTVAGRHDLPTTVVQQLSNDADAVVRNIFLPRDLSWSTVLEEKPDESVVTNSDFRDRIIATRLPWRVRDIGTNIEMLLIPPGRFMMGASPDDLEANSVEKPVHEVLISKAFYLGRTPVTQAQWQAKRGSNPSRFCRETDSPSRPVENVSWDMIQDFNSATGFRFPTEAEWEYACRAGSSTPRYGVLNDIAWYKDNSGGETHAVATKLPNALGFYDMLGNLWEWCQDFVSLYLIASMVNPTGPMTGTGRLLRGGCWNDYYFCRASQRNVNTPDYVDVGYGFRVARTP